jgi:putative ABC transport system ATP-binding protein
MTATVSSDVDALLTGPAATDLIYRVRDVRKVYRSGEVEVHALRSIDLDVKRGELLILLGASGSGKSTLLNILGALDLPSAGTVHFRDVDITKASDKARTRFRRASIGYVFQFYNLVPSLTARENVALVTDISDNPMPADDALEQAGLAERLDHFPAQLSGGEQQRVAIARAIAKRPAVLLCDEPTGALDYETGKLVLQALCHVNQRFGTTVIIITHNAAAAAIADRVVRLSSGQIVEVVSNSRRASPEELRW